MDKKTLYRYRSDGHVIDSLTKPEGEYTERVRIVADEKKRITKDGVTLYSVIDADSDEGFYEVDSPEEENSGSGEGKETSEVSL